MKRLSTPPSWPLRAFLGATTLLAIVAVWYVFESPPSSAQGDAPTFLVGAFLVAVGLVVLVAGFLSLEEAHDAARTIFVAGVATFVASSLVGASYIVSGDEFVTTAVGRLAVGVFAAESLAFIVASTRLAISWWGDRGNDELVTGEDL